MAAPILLVADDLPLITAVKRVLAREGYEVVLATSAADAVIAWGHSLPGLMVLQPSVESGRGPLLLDELDRHPDVKLLRVLLLGELIPGHPLPVEPLPIEPAHFARTVEENLRAAESSAPWRLMEAEKTLPPHASLDPSELDTWRATRPAELDEAELPPPERRSSETGDHLTDKLREAPSQVWPSPAPSPQAPIDGGEESRHPRTGRQYALIESQPPSWEEAADPRVSTAPQYPSPSAPVVPPAESPPSEPGRPLRTTGSGLAARQNVLTPAGRQHTPLEASPAPEGEPPVVPRRRTRPPALEASERTPGPGAPGNAPPSTSMPGPTEAPPVSTRSRSRPPMTPEDLLAGAGGEGQPSGHSETSSAPARRTLHPGSGESLPPSEQVTPHIPRRTILPVPSAGAALPLGESEPGENPSLLSPWSPSRVSPDDVVNPPGEPTRSLRKRPSGSGQRPLATSAPGASEPAIAASEQPVRLERETLLPLPGRSLDDELAIVTGQSGEGAPPADLDAPFAQTFVPVTPEADAPGEAGPVLDPFAGEVPETEWYAPPQVSLDGDAQRPAELAPEPDWDAAGEAVPPGLLRASRPAVSAPQLDSPSDFQPGEFVSSPLTPEEIEALQPTVPPGGGVVSSHSAESLAERLFGDLPALEDELHRRVEAEAIASLESALRGDDEPSRLPGAGLMTSSLSALSTEEEAPVAPVTARVVEALARAEAMVAEGREAYHEGLSELEADAVRHQEALEDASRRAEEAEALVQAEREERAGFEEEVLRLKASVELLEHAAVDQQASNAVTLEAARAHGAAQLTQREGELTETALAWQARAQGAEADLALLRAELDAQSNEVRQREHRLSEVSQRQADAIAALSRRHDEQVAELRYRLSEAQASAEISKAEATAVGEVTRQLSAEQAAHGETRRALAEFEAQRPVLEQSQADADAQRQAAVDLVEAGRARIAELETERAEHEAWRSELERQLETERAEHDARLVGDRAELEAQLWSQRSELEAQLAAQRTELEGERLARANGVTLLRAELEARLEAERVEHERLRSHERAQFEAERVVHEASVAELEGRLQAERVAHEARVVETRAQLEGQVEAERVAHEARVVETRAELEARLGAERAAYEAQLGEKVAELATAHASWEEARSVAVGLEAKLGEARTVHEALEVHATRLTEELERAAARQASLVTEVAQLKDELDGQRARAEGAEASASLSAGKVLELEHRNVKTLALPGRPPLGVSRHGTADLEALARLVCQLVLSQADAHLELGVVGGLRSLWLRKGQIVAAASSFEREGLIDRARRDGLIDGNQEAELRPLRGSTLKEQLEGLKARGFIRDVEAVPLVQRCAEQVALAALSEEETQYRLQDDTPGWEVAQVTIPRATLPLLAEALRRAVPVDTLLERLGGGDAVPVATDAELELRALGFSDRERRLLAKVDGTATVEELCLASGLKSDAAFRALEVAQLLGAIEVRAPERPSVRVDPELDVHRLEAKYDEVVDADYFTILGLPRTAGSDEVQSAWQRLSNEFHPLRFSGHPDAGLQQRAQVVFKLLEEAARALEDDRRRADYARHLLD